MMILKNMKQQQQQSVIGNALSRSGSNNSNRTTALHQHQRNNNNKRSGWCYSAAMATCLILILSGWYHFVMVVVIDNNNNNNNSSNESSSSSSSSRLAVSAAAAARSRSSSSSTSTSTSGRTTVEGVRQEFYDRYGGQEAADRLYQRGVTPFGSVQATAARLLRAAAASTATTKEFVLSFAGYSVTVGRGNHFSQSYPFVLERILRPLLQHELWNVTAVVRNAAIGGIPSYPYAFCLPHFLGPDDASVISWDYSMNEPSNKGGNGAVGAVGAATVLESYIRQSRAQLSQHRPMLIVLDTNAPRCQLVQKYAEAGLIGDALCVGMAKDAVTDQSLLLREPPPPPKRNGNAAAADAAEFEKSKPLGFQHWHEFGAPPDCPGRGNWHPKKMEHELIGWMIAMYFVEAVSVAKQMALRDPNWKITYGKATTAAAAAANQVVEFPKPMEATPDNDPAVTDLLYGHPTINSDGTTVYTMKQLSCRTSFLPATDEEKVLPSIVAAGLAPGITAANIMDERSEAVYASGWVLDVSKVERETKVKVEQCGGLGYVDMKIALYGIPASGPLRLWLPVSNDGAAALRHADHAHDDSSSSVLTAKHWFDEVIVCEANEKRKPGACQLDTDIEYTVGGVLVTAPKMIKGAAEYLKRQTCVHVGVPDGAVITKLSDVQSIGIGGGSGGAPLTADARRRLAGKDNPLADDHIGLVVDLRAKPNVSREQGACCVSHVVWELH